jgi:PIN domain nuclease of toxin-antitoxin system
VSRYVLDASALLALIRGEPGQDRVAAIIEDCAISAVNVAEVAQVMVRHGTDPNTLRDDMAGLDLTVVPFDEDMAWASVGFARPGLSLGDRACLALGARLGVPIVTADRAWAKLKLGLAIELVR